MKVGGEEGAGFEGEVVRGDSFGGEGEPVGAGGEDEEGDGIEIIDIGTD